MIDAAKTENANKTHRRPNRFIFAQIHYDASHTFERHDRKNADAPTIFLRKVGASGRASCDARRRLL